jgi:hypothetical protein
MSPHNSHKYTWRSPDGKPMGGRGMHMLYSLETQKERNHQEDQDGYGCIIDKMEWYGLD